MLAHGREVPASQPFLVPVVTSEYRINHLRLAIGETRCAVAHGTIARMGEGS